MNKVGVLQGQSLYDLAIQETGTVESVFELALKNNMSVTDTLPLDIPFEIPSEIAKEKKIVSYYKALNLKPATENKGSLGVAIGINFWTIEVDFTVSEK